MYYDIYDKAGNIRSIQDNLAAARAQTFTYKPIPSNPLAAARSTAYGNLGLTYDVSDNITNYTPVGVYTPKTGYSGLLEKAGPYSFSHDSNGNTQIIIEKNDQGVESGRRTIVYDYDQRVASIDNNGVVTSFAYDFSGMRVKKQTGASSTLYFGELFESTDGSNMKHIFAGSRRIASKKSTNEIYYYHTDHLGSTRVLTDKNGNEVQTFFYEPFGRTKAVTGSSPINYKYTGQEEDPETGLYYYKARYYDSVIGRFISHDPLFQAAFDPPTFPRLPVFSYAPSDPPIFSNGGSRENDKGMTGLGPRPVQTSLDSTTAAGLPVGTNLFSYVGNNPINFIDPWGLVCECEDFTVTFRGWKGWWGGFVWPWYTKRADVMFRLVLTEGSRREDCIITQFMTGESYSQGRLDAYTGGWYSDKAPGTLGWWDGTSWHSGYGNWNGNVAVFYDQPGFNRISEEEFPIRYSGEGGEGYFQFRTVVMDATSGNVVAQQDWGIEIDYSSPSSGSFSFTFGFGF